MLRTVVLNPNPLTSRVPKRFKFVSEILTLKESLSCSAPLPKDFKLTETIYLPGSILLSLLASLPM